MPSFERQQINLVARTHLAFGAAVTAFVLLLVRLWYLQIVQGDFFKEQSENNRYRTLYAAAPRGIVLDRDNVILAKNRPAFDIDLVLEDSVSPKVVLSKLATIIGRPEEELLKQLGPQRKRRRFEPKLIMRDVDRDAVAKIVARQHDLPGVEVSVTPTRDYLDSALAPHVIGYIREITGDQLKNPEFTGYRTGDLVGQYGLEAQWERYLQGRRGVQRVIVNAAGSRIGEAQEGFEEPRPGHDLKTTLDIDVQRAANKAMEGKAGGVVALQVNTGEILALTSAPVFNPNLFTQQISPEEWKELTSGPRKKLNNRVVQGAYPPGSIFKIFMAVAGLSEGVTTPDEVVYCPGSYQLGSRRFRCHKHSGHGPVRMHEAMIQSCDVYFYTIGQRLGVDRIHEYATKFGLGRKTGLKLVSEVDGLIPSTEWKRRYFKKAEDKKWYPGETPSVSIGQGAVTVTPLQMAVSVAAFVNGGNVLVPHLIKGIKSADGRFDDKDFGVEVRSTVSLNKKIVELVKASLEGVVNDSRGTAKKARLDDAYNITVAGKTGTAQVVSLELSSGGDHLADHAWFVGYAPADKPEVVVVALVENGGHGGAAAAPVVKQVLEAYFSKTRGVYPIKQEQKNDTEVVDVAD
jgi:penicillin-binding protein 2